MSKEFGVATINGLSGWGFVSDASLTCFPTGGAFIAGTQGGAKPGRLKYWSGSEWVVKPFEAWTGTESKEYPLKYWNGSEWVT